MTDKPRNDDPTADLGFQRALKNLLAAKPKVGKKPSAKSGQGRNPKKAKA